MRDEHFLQNWSEEKMHKNNNLPIKLAKPAQRALANAGITTLKELSKLSEEEITKLHGIGQNAVQQIRQTLTDN